MNINFNLPAIFIKPISNNHLLHETPYLTIYTGRINKENKLGEVYYVRPEIKYYKKTKLLVMSFNNNNLVNLNRNVVDNILNISGKILIENYSLKGSLLEQNVIVNLNIKNNNNLKINAITINNGKNSNLTGVIGKIIYFLYVKKYWLEKKTEYVKNNNDLRNFLPNTNIIQKLSN